MTKIKTLLIVLAFCGLVSPFYAQQSIGGAPVSTLFPGLAKRDVPVVKMPVVNVEALKQEDAANTSLEKPFRFGFPIDVRITPENAGIIDILPGGDKIWRVAVYTPGALSINFIFSQYKLPPGAQLFIYNADGSETIGAFTSNNNQSNEQLGTTLVTGDKVIVEYYEPAQVAFKGHLEIGTVVHGYRTLGESNSQDGGADDRGFGASGSCNINVNCTLGDGWNPEKRSVLKIVNGGDWCSGAMINNTLNNGTPYMLTANHCYTNNYPNWVYWFNYQSATCSNGTAPPYLTHTGATLKARRTDSDFCLLQLSAPLPPTYDVAFSGWDRSGVVPTQETCIHHPSGDIKKISRDEDDATNGTSGGWGSDHWRVYWDPGQGVTEGGSSGSPLFDQNKRIIGQLHGGASACGNSQSNMWDEYGKLSVSWNGASKSKRLKDWLDPNNSGVSTVNVYSPSGNYAMAVGPNGNVAGDPNTYTYKITATVNWTAESRSPWISVTDADPLSGLLTVRFEPNESLETRLGTIAVLGENGVGDLLTLRQFGAAAGTNDVPGLASVYPNPNTGRCIVDINGSGPATITVMDVEGRTLLQTKAEYRAELDLSAQPNGLYFVRVALNGQVTTMKLILKK